MKLSILIVNWDTRDLVVKCVHSILKHAVGINYEVIIVDNHSKDGSVEQLTNLFGHNKRIRVIQSFRNLGFAKANNLAYENSSGQYLLLLNPDTEIMEGSLPTMISYLQEHPEVGVLGPKLLNPDGTLQPSVRRFPGIWSSLVVFSGMHRFIRPKKYLMGDFTYDKVAEVDQVMGAALMTRREIVEKLGLFDDKFWLWYEEVDYCKRVKKAGSRVVFLPQASIVHFGAQSFGQLEVFMRKRIVAKSLVYYFQKNGHWYDLVLITVAMPAVLLAAKFLDFLQRLLKFKLKTRY